MFAPLHVSRAAGGDVSAAMQEVDELGGLVAVTDPKEGGGAVGEGLDVDFEARGEEGGFFVAGVFTGQFGGAGLAGG